MHIYTFVKHFRGLSPEILLAYRTAIYHVYLFLQPPISQMYNLNNTDPTSFA